MYKQLFKRRPGGVREASGALVGFRTSKTTVCENGAQMNAGRSQISSTMYKTDALSASHKSFKTKFSQKEVLGSILAPLGGFWVPFWCPLDFEGVPNVGPF